MPFIFVFHTKFPFEVSLTTKPLATSVAPLVIEETAELGSKSTVPINEPVATTLPLLSTLIELITSNLGPLNCLAHRKLPLVLSFTMKVSCWAVPVLDIKKFLVGEESKSTLPRKPPPIRTLPDESTAIAVPLSDCVPPILFAH